MTLTAKADGAHIVKCVNLHDELVHAFQIPLDYTPGVMYTLATVKGDV